MQALPRGVTFLPVHFPHALQLHLVEAIRAVVREAPFFTPACRGRERK